jgi:hypothetical protein
MTADAGCESVHYNGHREPERFGEVDAEKEGVEGVHTKHGSTSTAIVVFEYFFSMPVSESHDLQSVVLKPLWVLAVFARNDQHRVSKPQSRLLDLFGLIVEMVGNLTPGLVKGLEEDTKGLWIIGRIFDQTPGSHVLSPCPITH